jgi:radical SAM-linked protein
MKDNEKKFTLPMLEAPRTMRVKFRKVGNLQYISHLDLQRTFARVLVRAGLPLWYTKGFNPHIKMVFGLPLPVGCESECEFLDIRIEREMAQEEILARLNAELTEELAAIAVYPAERKFSEMAFAVYAYSIKTTDADEATVAAIKAALSDPALSYFKHSKAGDKEVLVSDYLRAFDVELADGVITLNATLSVGEGKTLTPEALISVLRARVGILSGDPTKESYRILRRRVLLADGMTDFT